jgi:hypothetical protein
VYKSKNLTSLNICTRILRGRIFSLYIGFFDYFVNLPVSIADSDSSLFKNKSIKPHFISNKSQERLSSLAFLSIENNSSELYFS